MQPTLDGLDVTRDGRQPWKRTTTTSKAAARAFEQSGHAEARRAICLKGLRAIWNRTQQWPCADELAADLHRRGQIPTAHRDEVAPRLNELADGWWVTVTVDKKKLRARRGGGLIERGDKRKSHIRGNAALTWRVREAGSAPVPRAAVDGA